jgi:hypothetical protein
VDVGRVRIFFEGPLESGQRLFEIPARLVIVGDEEVLLRRRVRTHLGTRVPYARLFADGKQRATA